MRLLIAAASFSLCASALAQDTQRPLEPTAAGGATATQSLFDRLDRNGDGYLTQEELASAEARGASWIAFDRNQDGKISRDEFTAFEGATVTQR